LTFRVMIRPLSRPSRTLTRTRLTSPVTPVRSRTWMTSEGVSSSATLKGYASLTS
jgi:hypothetical protein